MSDAITLNRRAFVIGMAASAFALPALAQSPASIPSFTQKDAKADPTKLIKFIRDNVGSDVTLDVRMAVKASHKGVDKKLIWDDFLLRVQDSRGETPTRILLPTNGVEGTKQIMKRGFFEWKGRFAISNENENEFRNIAPDALPDGFEGFLLNVTLG